jgi:hypothetical protein
MEDLIVALHDADARIFFARFVEQEGTRSTLEALRAVLTRCGRFAELYTDRGSHFARTPKAGGPSLADGQVSRALKTLGIPQILARSPEVAVEASEHSARFKVAYRRSSVSPESRITRARTSTSSGEWPPF